MCFWPQISTEPDGNLNRIFLIDGKTFKRIMLMTEIIEILFLIYLFY